MFLRIVRMNKPADSRKIAWIRNLSFGIASVSCICFPITIVEGYIYDLRLIAVTLGGLYGGVSGGLFLVVVTLTFRWLWLGGMGASASMIVCGCLLMILLALSKKFVGGSKRYKLIVGITVSVFASLLALVVSTLAFNVPIPSVTIVTYLSLTLFTTAIVIYLHEAFHESVLINERVIKAEKIELISHLSSSISHEVRNPLAVVRGFLQMMQKEELPAEKRGQFVELCIEEIDRANDIIRNYLTFSKPDEQQAELLNTKDQLEKAIRIIRPLANMNSVEIESRLEPIWVRGEPQLLQQCFLNLTKNCIEAMPDGGSLIIETYEDDKEAVIVIADTGHGMTDEQLSRIGEPYFTTKGREGTGLGMMATIRIVEMMRGKLSVSSHLKQGTTFTIRFPLEA
jgi:two-component system sporulation sensor kinase B